MTSTLRRAIRNTFFVAALVAAPIAATTSLVGCGASKSAGFTGANEFTGGQIVQGMLGVGPAATRFGPVATVAERVKHARDALQNGVIPAEALNQYNLDSVPQPGDPLPPPRQGGPLPTEAQLTALVPDLDATALPTDAQFERVTELVVGEIDRRAPGYLDSFATEMQSGDPGRVDKAMKVIRRSVVTVFESSELAARASTDPALAGMPAPPGAVKAQNEGDGDDGDNAGDGTTCSVGSSDKFHSCPGGLERAMLPSRPPGRDNTYKWDQFAVGTRVALGAYTAVALAIAGAVAIWVAAVKGLGPFIPLADMHDQNPGDDLKEEMKVGEIARAFAK